MHDWKYILDIHAHSSQYIYIRDYVDIIILRESVSLFMYGSTMLFYIHVQISTSRCAT